MQVLARRTKNNPILLGEPGEARGRGRGGGLEAGFWLD